MTESAPLAGRIKAQISEIGPISVAEYMTLCLLDPVDGYYPTRDPLGAGGDFITAPEISQMFGEMIGLWVMQAWVDLGQPNPFYLVELGPGRGTMMSDILRSLRLEPACFQACQVYLIEASSALQAVQGRTLGPSGAAIQWVEHLADIPSGQSVILGNEYLDCLPIRQFVKQDIGWTERRVGVGEDGDLRFETDITAMAGSEDFPEAEDGALFEVCPGAEQLVDQLTHRFADYPGRALFIDYGPATREFGDTLQAIKAHKKVDPLTLPGQCDLTARVDFEALIAHAKDSEIDAAGPETQTEFLTALGIEARALTLIRSNPDQKPKILRQLHRLMDSEEMGTLFKAVALSSSNLPKPAGF